MRATPARDAGVRLNLEASIATGTPGLENAPSYHLRPIRIRASSSPRGAWVRSTNTRDTFTWRERRSDLRFAKRRLGPLDEHA